MANMLAVAGPNSKYALGGEPAGFLAGLWHGMILPMTFIVGWFEPGVRVYETNNNGTWYELGFVIGVTGSVGGTASTT